ncbi:MAG: response regulator [Chloroflexi bacterium]|nr:response regulator [Chloroflexota bacterium]
MNRNGPIQPILVADDDKAIRDFIRQALEDEGYAVVTAADGREALELLAVVRPAAILVDVAMPNVDGVHLIDAYRRRPAPHAPIVLCSARLDLSLTAAQMHVDALLAKPFDLEELLDVCKQAVARSEPVPA